MQLPNRVCVENPTQKYDVICVSHLRWSFVFQRPQHLLSRCARTRRVFFVEEPIFVEQGPSRLQVTLSDENVHVVVPLIAEGTLDPELEQAQMLRTLIKQEHIETYVLWYYTPMALPITTGLSPAAIVYDCMDQLAAFKNAPPCLIEREQELFRRADLVFTGGQSLYEEKRNKHPNVHAFPSSVDTAHFGKARLQQVEPEDQRAIPRPRLGFFGVIDERMDLDLLAAVAAAKPAWQLVVLGPVVKIDHDDLPKAPNIHYLGSKSYAELPSYIAGWDVALLPFARNESTQFISPTKTPEYLAAGKPVVSTSIRDVIRPYQGLGLARIADTADEFVAACEAAMREPAGQRILKADAFLSRQSWDKTWRDMQDCVDEVLQQRRRPISSTLLKIAQPANQQPRTAARGGG
jgi:UDP-galactopyranose mutase